jgi:hypothetical protein
MTDHKLFGQGANSWQFISVLEDACLDGMMNLLHQLQV